MIVDIHTHNRKTEAKTIEAVGIHPWHAATGDISTVEERVSNIDAIGEIGLDFYWSRDWQAEQSEAFRAQVELALRYDLPVVVHTRDAWAEMAEIVDEYRGRGLRGVFHAFSADVEMYERLRECGEFVFGIGGVVTFKKSALAEIVKAMRLEDLVVETDAPYLTPTPHRGTRNESSYVRFVVAKIAELQGVDYEVVAEQTTANAKRIFRL